MIIRIKKPEFLGAYKLSEQAQRVAVKNMINKQIQLMKSVNQKVSAVIIYGGEKEYILTLKTKQNE